MARLLLAALLILATACADPDAVGVGSGAGDPASPSAPTAPPSVTAAATPSESAAGMVAECPPWESAEPGPLPEEEMTEYWANPTEEELAPVQALQDEPFFGGYMIERSPDGPFFRVFVTDEVERVQAQLDEAAGEEGWDHVVEQVTHTEAELRALQDQLFSSPVDLGPSAQLFGGGVDVEHNVVAVDVVAVDDTARMALAEAYGTERLCINPMEGPPADVAPGGGAEGVVAVPTSDIANMQQALLEGTLRADGTDCLWVEGGSAATDIVWPPGYGARETPEGVELVDHTGTVVAREGDDVALGGGFHADTGAGCAPGADGAGAFVAGDVTTR